MKIKPKILAFVLSLCLCFTNIVGFSTIASAEDNLTYSVTLEDVLAGMADPSQLDGGISRAMTANTTIADGTYYLNGEYSGDYLRNSSSSPVAQSGTFSSLGSSIRWIITNVSGSFTIRSASNTSKYLAVPTSSTTSSTVQLVSVTGTTIPTECLWNISIADGGGCLVQNVYNSRYLYSSGSTVSTSNTTGSSGSSSYNMRVWRVAELSYISGRELNQSADFSTLILSLGNTGSPSITKSPTNAIWASKTDFNYTRQSTAYVSVSNGVFTGNSTGVTTVIAKHKVTDLEFVFAVVVGDQPTFTISNYVDQGYRVRFGGYTNTQTFNTVVRTKFEQFFGLSSTSSYTLHTSSADTCKIKQFDAVESDNLTSDCPHLFGHLTDDDLRDEMGNGTNVNSRVLWTGHIRPGNPSSNSLSSRHSVIITPKHTTDDSSTDYPNKSDAEVRIESIFTLMHELSHQLGAPDHYCYGIEPGETSCINDHCDICVNGETRERSCMMTYRYDIEDTKESTLYCSSCLADIGNHLSGHHQ